MKRARALAAEENLIPANTAEQVVASGGLGAFSALDLEKKLAGKAVFVRPTIGELEEGLRGSASPRDAETLFQMIYLEFAAPRPVPDPKCTRSVLTRCCLGQRPAAAFPPGPVSAL